MNVSNAQIQELFRKIPDPKLRGQLSDLVNSKAVKAVYCVSDTCKGRLVAHITDTGKVNAITEKDGKTWLKSSRHRFDGFMGFECWCGNDSRLAAQEKGYIGASAPDKSALQKVWEKVNDKPSDYPLIRGSQTIDGFKIEEIK